MTFAFESTVRFMHEVKEFSIIVDIFNDVARQKLRDLGGPVFWTTLYSSL